MWILGLKGFRQCYTGRFTTKIFSAQQTVATLLRHVSNFANCSSSFVILAELLNHENKENFGILLYQKSLVRPTTRGFNLYFIKGKLSTPVLFK